MIIFVIVIPLITVFWILFPINPFPRNVPGYDEISDQTLINRTKDLQEVKALIYNYPNGSIYVDRVEHFGVEYHLYKTSDWAMLKVYLNDDGFPTSTMITCEGARHELHPPGDLAQIARIGRGHLCS